MKMDEERWKLMTAADAERTRICGGDAEYLRWLGRAALVTSMLEACKRLMDLAEAQGRPFEDKVKIQVELLRWYGQTVSMTGSLIESVRGVIDSSAGETLPFGLLEPLVWMYVSAHRVAYALWRDREETRLL